MKTALQLLEKIKKDKKIAALAAAGLICLLSVFFSGITDTGGDDKKANTPVFSEVSAEKYAKSLERRLETILSSLDGAGEVRVMVTLDSYYETVYSKQTLQKSEDGSVKKDEISEEYVTLKKGANNEEPLITKISEPSVRGVAVTAEGGGDAAVKKAITDTVCSVFGISSTRVSVEKMYTPE